MTELFGFLWQLNALTNSLVEPVELTRTLLEDAEAFLTRLDTESAEAGEYAKRDLFAAAAYLDEALPLLQRLREELEARYLRQGGSVEE